MKIKRSVIEEAVKKIFREAYTPQLRKKGDWIKAGGGIESFGKVVSEPFKNDFKGGKRLEVKVEWPDDSFVGDGWAVTTVEADGGKDSWSKTVSRKEVAAAIKKSEQVANKLKEMLRG